MNNFKTFYFGLQWYEIASTLPWVIIIQNRRSRFNSGFNSNYQVITIYVVHQLRILVRASQSYLMSGTYNFPIQIWNRLRDRYLFNFFLLHHILVVHTNIYFCEWLKFNLFIHTFVHFTIVVLTWHDLTSYSKVLPMSISAWVFHTLSIFLLCYLRHY